MIDPYNEVGLPVSALEQVYEGKAKPVGECPFPKCESCDKYHGSWCTVPIVISKQIFRLTEEKLYVMDKRLTDLEDLVTDQILGLERERRLP